MAKAARNARLEVPIFGPSSTATAVLGGAARLELNAAGSYPDGGTTPSAAELVAVNTALDASAPDGCVGENRVSVRVMIRPRGPPPPAPAPAPSDQNHRGAGRAREVLAGVDFQYTPFEVDAMLASISELKTHLILARGDGFVFGALIVGASTCADTDTDDNTTTTTTATPNTSGAGPSGEVHIAIDRDTCSRLVGAAAPFPCVFHRAFDLLVSPLLLTPPTTPPATATTSSGSPPGSSATGSSHPAQRTRAAVEEVAALGFAGILTSGGVGNATENIGNGRLAEIVDYARSLLSCRVEAVEEGEEEEDEEGGGERGGTRGGGRAEMGTRRGIEIILGGGVRSGNVTEILAGIDRMKKAGAGRSMGGDREQQIAAADGEDATDEEQWVHSSCLTVKGSEDVDGDEVRRIVGAISRQW